MQLSPAQVMTTPFFELFRPANKQKTWCPLWRLFCSHITHSSSSGNPIAFTFKVYPESEHFAPSPLPAFLAKPLLSLNSFEIVSHSLQPGFNTATRVILMILSHIMPILSSKQHGPHFSLSKNKTLQWPLWFILSRSVLHLVLISTLSLIHFTPVTLDS